MVGVLSGLRVLDLSHGIAGPMACMLMADHGAAVTRLEPPRPGPVGDLPGHAVWDRGKRSAVLDLTDPATRDAFHALVRDADVLVESCTPARRAALGLGHDVLAALNPRLVHCSITAYGEDGPDAGRRGYDALVAARAGLHWEKRGWPGGGINRQAGVEDPLAGLDVPPGAVEGPDRDGPLFSALPLPSIGACHLASVGVAAALRAREVTGRGQHVRTSLLQGVFAAVIGGWQRIQHVDRPWLQTWIFDRRAPLGVFRCADGRWVHNWVPNPSWILEMGSQDVASLDELPDDVVAGGGRHRDDPTRLTPEPENLVVLHHYLPLMAEAFARFPADEWERAAARKGSPLQIVRSPEAALSDPWWLADGCVAELDDPERGRLRMVGRTYSVQQAGGAGEPDGMPLRAAPRRGEHTQEVLAGIGASSGGTSADALPADAALTAPLSSPLAGVRVLDLGLAIAGPYGCQVLADLGADVVKINALHDGFWQVNHIAMTANRNKRSLAVNLKDPRGLDVLRRMVARADVVQHNMRYAAAVRLGVDEDSLRTVNPSLVYCHTRGFEQDGPRTALPGNDQTGAALAGVEWADGGCDDGGRPIWSRTNFGDTGNGLLSALGIVQALTARARTGQGARVDTSIVYAQLLAAAATGVHVRAADGAEPGDGYPRMDADHLGLGPYYRLYACADGRWLFLAAVTPHERSLLAAVLAQPPTGVRASRLPDDPAAVAKVLEEVFAAADADAWAAHLDAAGVPAEISSETYSLEVFDDPGLAARGWTVAFDHPYVGRVETTGLGVDLSGTPGVLWGPTPVVGQHSRDVLTDYGFAAEEIDALIEAGVVHAWAPGDPVLPAR